MTSLFFIDNLSNPSIIKNIKQKFFHYAIQKNNLFPDYYRWVYYNNFVFDGFCFAECRKV